MKLNRQASTPHKIGFGMPASHMTAATATPSPALMIVTVSRYVEIARWASPITTLTARLSLRCGASSMHLRVNALPAASRK